MVWGDGMVGIEEGRGYVFTPFFFIVGQFAVRKYINFG